MSIFDEDKNKKVPVKFNAGIAKLERLHFIRLKIHNARMDKDYITWFDNLQSWRSEINDRLSPEERQKAKEFELQIKDGINDFGRRKSRMQTNHGFIDETKAARGLTFTDNLFDYELWLSDIEKEYGYGMPEQDLDEGL